LSRNDKKKLFSQEMGRNIFFIMTILTMVVILTPGCNYRLRKQAVGKYTIEDIRLEGDLSVYDSAKLWQNIARQKQIWFEIKPGTLIYVYTEHTRLEGIWHVKWWGRKVFAHLEDSPSGNLLLGRYRDDRITHIDTMPLGTVIITTFLKEIPPEEQEQQ